MKSIDVVLAIGILASAIQFFLLGRKFLSKQVRSTDLLVLNSTCLIFLGFIFHCYFGFPLEEGVLKPTEIPLYENRLMVADYLLFVGFGFPMMRVIRII